jgi:hypothetical protein
MFIPNLFTSSITKLITFECYYPNLFLFITFFQNNYSCFLISKSTFVNTVIPKVKDMFIGSFS